VILIYLLIFIIPKNSENVDTTVDKSFLNLSSTESSVNISDEANEKMKILSEIASSDTSVDSTRIDLSLSSNEDTEKINIQNLIPQTNSLESVSTPDVDIILIGNFQATISKEFMESDSSNFDKTKLPELLQQYKQMAQLLKSLNSSQNL